VSPKQPIIDALDAETREIAMNINDTLVHAMDEINLALSSNSAFHIDQHGRQLFLYKLITGAMNWGRYGIASVASLDDIFSLLVTAGIAPQGVAESIAGNYCGGSKGIVRSDKCHAICMEDVRNAGRVNTRAMRRCLECKKHKHMADLGCALHDFCGEMPGRHSQGTWCPIAGCHCKCDFDFVMHQKRAMVDAGCLRERNCREVAVITHDFYKNMASCWEKTGFYIHVPYFQCRCRSCSCPKVGIKRIKLYDYEKCYIKGSGEVRG